MPDVVIEDFEAVAAQLVQGGVLVAGVPKHDGVDDKSEGAELVFLAFAVALAELSSLAVEDRSGAGPTAVGPWGRRAPGALADSGAGSRPPGQLIVRLLLVVGPVRLLLSTVLAEMV